MYVGHSNGTQVVPKILESKNMMLDLSKALSIVPIGFLGVDCDECTFLKISKFSFLSQIFKNRNRTIPAENLYPIFVFEFFDVRTLLYIKWRHWGHVMVVTVHKFLPHKPIF